ncbi:MAG: PAS domain S-box protein, partial [Bryobacteraceae bacterium]
MTPDDNQRDDVRQWLAADTDVSALRPGQTQGLGYFARSVRLLADRVATSPGASAAVVFMVSALVVVSLAFVWELWLERPISAYLGLPYDEGVEVNSRWRFVEVMALFAGLVLIAPIVAIWRILALHARQTRELTESHENLRALLENAALGIFILEGPDIIFANPHGARILGYSVEELRRRPFLDIVHPDSRALALERYRRRLAGEKIEEHYEIVVTVKDGRAATLDIHAALTHWGGRVANMVFFSDITARRLVEAKLAQYSDNLEALLENASLGIVIIEGPHIVFINPYGASIVGCQAEEICGREFLEFFPSDARMQAVDRHRRRLAGEQVEQHFEAVLMDKGGRAVAIDLHVALTYWGGRVASMVFFADITERKRAEAELAQYSDNLHALMENAGVGIGLLEGDKIVFANPHAAKILGYTVTELAGTSFGALIHPDYRAEAMARYHRRLAGGPAENHYELVALAKGGREVVLEVNATLT